MRIAPRTTAIIATKTRSFSVQSFNRHDGGNVASMFALCIAALFGLVGGAIDFAQVHRIRTAISGGIDAGMLAGARAKQTGATDDEAIAIAESYLKPIMTRFRLTTPVEFKIGDGGTSVAGAADIAMPTSFLRVIGINDLPVKISNAASFGNRSNVELSMMLDITGSMSGQKIVDLKAAVTDLIDVVVIDNQVGASARIAMAPFSNAVRLDNNLFRDATGKDNSGTSSYKGCVVEREGANRYTDAAPAPGDYVTPLEDKTFFAYCKDKSEIMPLTNKKSQLKQLVADWTAGGATAGHLGTAWAWYLLSPNWALLFDKDSQPASYDDMKRTIGISKTPYLRKIAVLMTDGEYNTQYTSTDSNTQARATCAEMKKTGIEVFTVGFAIGTTGSAVDTLKACATDLNHFYNATDGNTLKQAFRDIALKSSPLRIVK